MGELKNRTIVQSRNWLDPNTLPIPPYDYDYIYPITVYEAVKSSLRDDASNLGDELQSIYRLIDAKQNIIEGGNPGAIMTWSGVRGSVGSLPVTKVIDKDPAARSHNKIPTERAVGDYLDVMAPLSALNSHTQNSSIHITDVERTRWNAMASLSTLQAHISNAVLHITNEERQRWNGKTDQTEFDKHALDTNNPHHVTAADIPTYTIEQIERRFAEIRETFFNYLTIRYDSITLIDQPKLVPYDPRDWSPDFILRFEENLPDIDPNDADYYFALRPATDYDGSQGGYPNETNEVEIWYKLPGLNWAPGKEPQTLKPGDMVIQYPGAILWLWVQGHFMQVISTHAGEEFKGGSGPAFDGKRWYPHVDTETGMLTWELSPEELDPAPVKIVGKDGKPGEDGEDGKGVIAGGLYGDILVKASEDNYDTTWMNLKQIVTDLVEIQQESLPFGTIKWDDIKDKPKLDDEFGENEHHIVNQRAITNRFENLDSVIEQIQNKINGVDGLDGAIAGLHDHLADKTNPHEVTPNQIKAASIEAFNAHVNDHNNPHKVNQSNIGLHNVDNTADLDKPISHATKAALDLLHKMFKQIMDPIDELGYIINAAWSDQESSLIFTFLDKTELKVKVPITEVFNSIHYDNATKELVITLPDGNKHRINIKELIQVYTGHVGTHINVIIEDNQLIKADIIPSSIGELEVTPSIHLRGEPTTQTQPVNDRSTRIATTEFVRGQVINNLISYEVDRSLSANMGRILNERKANVDDVIQIIMDLQGAEVVDHLDSTSNIAALSANMGRHLDLIKAPRVHTSPSGATFGRGTISLFGHTRASDVDPLMDGTVFRGTDDGYYARADHRHPTDITRAPIHFPDTVHNQYSFTGEPRSTLPPDDSNDDRIVTTEWVRRNACGVNKGFCSTPGNDPIKIVTLKSDFMDPVFFLRQKGSTIVVTFDDTDLVTAPTQLNVHGSGNAPVVFGSMPITKNMIKAGYSHSFTFNGTQWCLINPAGIHTLPDSDNSNQFVSSEWVRRNACGVNFGRSDTLGIQPAKTATLKSTFMSDPVFFLRQIGSTVVITFTEEDRSGSMDTTLDVQGTGAAPIIFAGDPLMDGMLGENHAHMFTFDGENWLLINPVPGTGLGTTTTGGVETEETIIDENTGYNGYTTRGIDGVENEHGEVNRVWFTIIFAPRSVDVEVTLSDKPERFYAMMGNGDFIPLTDPEVLSNTRYSALVQFNMTEFHPFNSPCQLIRHTSNATITITERRGS
jgi:hypothetical protein